MAMSSLLEQKKMHKGPVSILILATLPDNGIKSLGSKSLLKIKDRPIIQHQIEAIDAALKNIEHDITLMCAFDCQRVYRVLKADDRKLNIKIVKQNDNNLNFAGSFIEGLSHVKSNNVISINYGALFTKNVIQSLIADRGKNNIAISKNHSYNENIKVGCFTDHNKVVNVFFNIGEYKYLDVNFWSENSISYIRQNLLFDDHKHKFMFEIINMMINHNHNFTASIIGHKDCLLVDNLASLTKSKRIFIDVNSKNNKTKY